jgi:hypothetical protein
MSFYPLGRVMINRPKLKEIFYLSEGVFYFTGVPLGFNYSMGFEI